MTKDIEHVKYFCPPYLRKSKKQSSIQPIGFDTEADRQGRCFMIATSLGDVFRPERVPACFFSRKYRGQSFVCYNLKYDSGALVQRLSSAHLKELQVNDSTVESGYTYSAIANKCLTIRRGKNSVHIYDMLNFYSMSLSKACELYLDEMKIDISPDLFSEPFITSNFAEIAEYCVQDAILVEKLADLIIKRFESYGVYPQKLYSIAYISFQYFRTHTPYVIVKRFWEKERELLSMAMQSYNGGKFEVTRKGTGYFHEYDIVSAYPFEIRNLIDISWARVVRENKYRKNAIYGFLRVKMNIPVQVFSPSVVMRGTVNTYPVGNIERVITKSEYEYLVSQGVDISILDAYWIHVTNKQFPYRREIDKLSKLKDSFKQSGKELDYHTIKILLNSLYGKMVQLIDKKEYFQAGASWNPIYGAVITANVRIRVSSMQQTFPEVVAVHTDSVLSTAALPLETSSDLGAFEKKAEGEGVIIGSGIYQVGNKVKLRGIEKNLSLLELIQVCGKQLSIDCQHVYSWREVAFRGWDTFHINLFDTVPKKIEVNFDQKRLWIDDWKTWQDVVKHPVESVPLVNSSFLF